MSHDEVALRKALIRLAHEKTELRPHLLPLLREAAAPRGKAQVALMGVVSKWPAGHSEHLSELIKFKPEFRGTHFAKIMSAAEALDKKGLLSFDGSTVSKRAAAAKKAGFQNQLPREFQGLVGSVGRQLQWSIDDAFAFCVALLEDVNAHKEAAAVDRLLSQF